jgi:ribosomal protein L29
MARTDYTTQTAAELRIQLAAEQGKLVQMRFDLADKKVKRTSDIREARRRIARIQTALRTAKN